ncbi:dTDP-glucose 4,6-dehydratase [Flavobacteriales bacterium]|nr:dTDP-glucose 4,6-dehydratase [Flavobacteriales bacterium]
MNFQKNILVTGGAGFIGSHVVRRLVNNYPTYKIVNLDALTYAGNLSNLKDIESAPNYLFEKGNICDAALVAEIFSKHDIDAVIHLAAESHVDRSISNPTEFVMTNIIGTVNLLNAAKACWGENIEGKCFYHISTDEVYGTLGKEGLFTEKTPYDPRSPYSSSKASSDHIVRSYFHTYKLPVKLSNCSNNYGANQFPEKLIPLIINNIKNEKPLPVYGEGLNIRDWLWVEDHASAIDTVFHNGKVGETYNIGGLNEWKNIDLVHMICDQMDEKLGQIKGSSRSLITFVKDRAGHDLRYAIDASKIENELGWKPSITFEQGLSLTIDWYMKNESWLNDLTSGEYKKYYANQYTNR